MGTARPNQSAADHADNGQSAGPGIPETLAAESVFEKSLTWPCEPFQHQPGYRQLNELFAGWDCAFIGANASPE